MVHVNEADRLHDMRKMCVDPLAKVNQHDSITNHNVSKC